MPSFKMKTKSSGDFTRESNGLHVCQKSSKISKNSFTHTRNLQHESELDTRTTPNVQDDSFCNKADERTNCCQMVDGDNIQIQKHISPSSAMDHTETCSSTIETIFSPILDSIDTEPNIYDYGGKQWRESDLVLPSCGDDDVNDSLRMSCEYSDMFIPDMIVSSSRLLDYEYDESSRFFGDECLLLPFLEDNIQTENRYVDGYSEPVSVSEDSNLYVAIHQMKPPNQDSDVGSYPDWDPADFLDPQMFIRNLIDLSEISTSSHHSRTKSITLALDLDETLVHSSLEHCDDADFTFSVFSSLKEHTVYVKQRPYLRTFLEKVSEMFHIVIFTASQSIYAKKLLDILDPDGTIISRRAYRDSCIFADGSYTKDLTVLGVDLAKIVIIDNSPQVFRLQVNNGIPIKSWFDDPSDCALISLLPFLESLVDAQDVRPIIAKRFGNKE
uniref:Putative FCP1-like domain, HAD-like domain protein n=1 Tax=Helianthus annuus TaxID=4232 RepID=A0A251RTV4_HELAN